MDSESISKQEKKKKEMESEHGQIYIYHVVQF